MDYKARFQPLEIFADGRWSLLEDTDTSALVRRRGDRPAISEQVAAIELPSTQIDGLQGREARAGSRLAALPCRQPLVRLRIMKVS